MTTPAERAEGDRAHHDFREWPIHFLQLWNGTRGHEVRRDDRKPAILEGDTATFHEWLPDARRPTGRWVRCAIGYVTRPGTVGTNAHVPAGVVVFTVRELARGPESP